MNNRTTQKAVKNHFSKVISVNYCGLQHLLTMERVDCHTERREGWGADVYDFGNVAIVTGYAPFGNVKPSYEVVSRYDNEARKLLNSYWTNYDEMKEKLTALIEKFIEEVTQ